jgi:transposase
MRNHRFDHWRLISKCLKTVHDPCARHRLSALGAIACGNPVGLVSEWFGVSRQTLYNWMERFSRSRFSSQALADNPRPGRPPQWERGFDRIVKSALRKSPRHFGYKSRNWTVGLLQSHLDSCLGQFFSHNTVRRHLHGLGYVWKRPRYALSKDPEAEKKSPNAKGPAFIA